MRKRIIYRQVITQANHHLNGLHRTTKERSLNQHELHTRTVKMNKRQNSSHHVHALCARAGTTRQNPFQITSPIRDIFTLAGRAV
jgi:hypothetical protein